MDWGRQLDALAERLSCDNATDSFRQAFGVLEHAYTRQAIARGLASERSPMAACIDALRSARAISEADADAAHGLRDRRNRVQHESGVAMRICVREAEQAITTVRALCARFADRVADCMTTDVIVARPDQRVGEFVDAMCEGGISQFPVIDSGEVVGTLTDKAVLGRWIGEEGLLVLHDTPVRELMVEPLPSVRPDAPLTDAHATLRRTGADALLVSSDGEALSGIITKWDLLQRGPLGVS
jgi:predicted transcriptional regulator